MKASIILMITLLCFVLVGCNESVQQGPDKREINIKLINSFNDIAMENAIISQHTLFPYHFVNNSATLNVLGQRDLAVLVKHFTGNPGDLGIRRGNTNESLYNARVDAVLTAISEAGIDMAQVQTSDSMAGGSGMTSERVLTILKNEDSRSGR